MSDLNFQKWLMSHQPDYELRYANSFWDTCTFWRDDIFPMFTDEFYKKHPKMQIIWDETNRNTEIISTHYSKSILNPVLKINYRGTTIIFRYNYHNYEIAVISAKPIIIDNAKLFTSKDSQFFYEGFPECYKLTDTYESNQCRFMIHIDNHYKFYTFMYLLQRQIYLNSIKNF